MTPSPKPIPTTLEDINDELIALQFNLEHIYHSAMEHFDLLTRKDDLESEKAKWEVEEKE
jgi:hypothetical protein